MRSAFTGAFAPYAMTTTEVRAFFELLMNSAVSNFRTRPA